MHVLLNMVNGDRFVTEYEGHDIVKFSIIMDRIGTSFCCVSMKEVDGPMHLEYMVRPSHIVSMREMPDWEYNSLMSDDYGGILDD